MSLGSVSQVIPSWLLGSQDIINKVKLVAWLKSYEDDTYQI